ncbi:MAG: asparaginase [Gemmatimonadota bacterium]|nr:asparaginase [Gemmatimonadota bacterium]
MIRLVCTGGTISMQPDAAAGGLVPALGAELLAEIAGGRDVLGEITVEDWERLPGSHMGPARLWALREHVAELAARRDVDAVVITHGTDTLEETAYVLARTLARDAAPVVLTGAMRTAGTPEWDGARNLRDAVRVARSPAARGRGPLVVFAGRILPAALATKVHATALDAFGTPHGNPTGTVDERGLSFTSATPPVAAEPLVARRGLEPRVALVTLVTGDEGELVEAARSDFDGLVIEGFGAGNVPPGALPALERWRDDGKPVVLASRCAEGQVEPAYGFQGGGAGLVALGVVPAGPRTPAQARIELILSLSAGTPYGGRQVAR